MKCAACGAPLSAWHRFCADCGEARPRWPEPFEDCLARFQSLTSRWEQGILSDQQYEAGLRDLAFPYEDSYWTIGAQSGNWYRHDGRGWLRDDPPQVVVSSDSLPFDSTPTAPSPATTAPVVSTPAASVPMDAEPTPAAKPAEPFALDEEDEPPRQEPTPPITSPSSTGAAPVLGPRPTVRLNMPEEATPVASAPTPAAAPVTASVVPPSSRVSRPAPLQAQQQPQRDTGLGCVRPALTGFVAALVLLCVLIVLAAWLEPALLRPLTRLLWPGG